MRSQDHAPGFNSIFHLEPSGCFFLSLSFQPGEPTVLRLAPLFLPRCPQGDLWWGGRWERKESRGCSIQSCRELRPLGLDQGGGDRGLSVAFIHEDRGVGGSCVADQVPGEPGRRPGPTLPTPLSFTFPSPDLGHPGPTVLHSSTFLSPEDDGITCHTAGGGLRGMVGT